MASIRSLVGRRALARLGGVDGVIQIGSDFSLPPGVRYVTWEDMTIALCRGPRYQTPSNQTPERRRG